MSLVNDGIDLSYCRQLDSMVVKNFGAKYCFLFENLFKIGLLHPHDDIKAWDYAKRHLSLFVPDYNEQDPNDLSYVYGGVAPISCRLVEHALTVPISALANAKLKDVLVKGWGDQQIDKKVKRVKGGAAFYLVQTIDFEKIAKNLKSLTSIILIVFVGGITYSEIAALRFLAKRNPGKSVIVATPKVINGTNFIESLL